MLLLLQVLDFRVQHLFVGRLSVFEIHHVLVHVCYLLFRFCYFFLLLLQVLLCRLQLCRELQHLLVARLLEVDHFLPQFGDGQRRLLGGCLVLESHLVRARLAHLFFSGELVDLLSELLFCVLALFSRLLVRCD